MAEVAKALRDPVRVQLVDVLREHAGKVCVCELVRLFVGLPGHFVVGYFRADPPVLFDPFAADATVTTAATAQGMVQPWNARQIAMRMLNDLVAACQRRGDLAGPGMPAAGRSGWALHAAALRTPLPVAEPQLQTSSKPSRDPS